MYVISVCTGLVATYRSRLDFPHPESPTKANLIRARPGTVRGVPGGESEIIEFLAVVPVIVEARLEDALSLV